MTIAAAVRSARLAAGLTQAELAKRIKMTVNFVSLLECGDRMPSLKTLLRIGKATGRTPVISFVATAPASGASADPAAAQDQ